MKKMLILTGALAMAGPALADTGETQGGEAVLAPVVLTDEVLDQITAGDLLLPNGKLQFEGIDNPGKDADTFICTDLGMCHPTFGRSLTAIFELFGKETGSGGQVPGLEGPWAAGRNDNPIECVDCP
ncbi:hypothetical protein [Qipengyuania sphaerica]|uniref:hypothetical protein n=1 Tax=Qipengyuania sphaerica TaxID=2867243 RepID=UPI001C883723|nr:hypothetical protein [Qipengyuania sphaerica]MBX7539661.1 hypothetical protein [Qipengyuania sphaerica]